MHLSTGSSGGAAIAARRLNQALCEFGLDSQFISIQRKNFLPEANEVEMHRSLISRLTSAVYVKINSFISTKIPFSVFSSSVLDYKKLSNLGSPSSTILHIHNWYNLVNFKELSRLSDLGYKIVFTMHDQRVFTGGCHTAFACIGFHSNCKKCPNVSRLASRMPSLNLERMTKYSKGFMGKAIFIAPSNWILNEAKKSQLLRGLRIKLFPIHCTPIF